MRWGAITYFHFSIPTFDDFLFFFWWFIWANGVLNSCIKQEYSSDFLNDKRIGFLKPELRGSSEIIYKYELTTILHISNVVECPKLEEKHPYELFKAHMIYGETEEKYDEVISNRPRKLFSTPKTIKYPNL